MNCENQGITDNKDFNNNCKMALFRRYQISLDKYGDSSIDVLPASKRLKNLLHRNGCHTIRDYLYLSESDIVEFKSCGTKTVREALIMAQYLAANDIQICDNNTVINNKINNIEEKEPLFIRYHIDLDKYGDILINTLPISNRLKNALLRYGYQTTREYLNLSERDLAALKNSGKSTVMEALILAQNLAAGKMNISNKEPFISSFLYEWCNGKQ